MAVEVDDGKVCREAVIEVNRHVALEQEVFVQEQSHRPTPGPR
jgi:hypothetical protein